MTSRVSCSTFKYALPLTLALAAISGAVIAQEKTQSSQIIIQGRPVQVTTVGRSDPQEARKRDCQGGLRGTAGRGPIGRVRR